MREAVCNEVSAQERARILLESHAFGHQAACNEIVRNRMIEALTRDDTDAYLYWREVREVLSRKAATAGGVKPIGATLAPA